ncbi:putative uncharacterized protein [Clostridium sp. CAG:253]|jgi:lipopolysaccharide transport system permease protein|nr:putative uncharacterized protein [Clostridium sp. CAG:253]
MLETLKEVFRYREMIYSMVRRDLRGRYKKSALGFLWTFINPLCQIVIYTVVFSVIMRAGIEKFYLYLIVAMIPWIFFSSSITGGSMSIVSQQDMVKKIYFPRLVLPISYVTSCFVNMLFCFVIIFLVIFVSGTGISLVPLLFLPITMLLEYFFALGLAMIVSACTVYVRDLEHILGVITMAWIYLTPIMYTMDIVPERLRFVFYMNPMTYIVNLYRAILYYKTVPGLLDLGISFIVALVAMVVGMLVFDRLQRGFVEEL